MAAGFLLAACGGAQPSRASSPTPRSHPSPSPAPTLAPMPEIASTYRAAAAQYPPLNLDLCGPTTAFDDAACGGQLTTAQKIADGTAQKLGDLSSRRYSAVIGAADQLDESFSQLEQPIGCYGLGSAPPPAPEQAGQAQSICAEAAAIAKTRWNIFISQIELYSGQKVQ